MIHRKRLAAFLAVGLAAGILSPAFSEAAKKVKAITQPPGAKASAARQTACKKKGYAKYGFKNQGQCIAYGATATPATATPAPAATQAPATQAPAAAAPVATAGKKGGKVIMAVGAESNGWLPATQNWASEGSQVSISVIERLMAFDDKGQPSPWLLKSMTPNGSYTEWRMTVRDGIKFHNGEPLNADAVAQNIASVRKGFITANVFLNLGECNVESEMVLICKTKKPWVSLPVYFTGATGAIVAPAQIKANDATKPIGTGPFVFKEWIPNVKFVATKNPNYWQKGLPVADEIEFRVLLSDDARLAQIQSGQVDYIQTNTAVAVAEYEKLAKAQKVKAYVNEGATAINYDLLNNAIPPFSNRDCRLAAAQALDIDTLIKLRAPVNTKATGPFAKGVIGYVADPGYPKYDLDAAKASFEKCKAAGSAFTAFTMATTTSPEAIETRNIKKQMVERAGFSIKTVEIPQDQYIPAALTGAFQWQTWRLFGSPDPDGERIWLASETAIPAPGIALNFGRVKDGNIDAALDQIRGSSDPVVRQRAAEIITTSYANEVYAIWNWNSKYLIAACNSCSGIEDARLPDGSKPQLNQGGVFNGLAYLTGKQ